MTKPTISFLSGLATGIITTIGSIIVASLIAIEPEEEEIKNEKPITLYSTLTKVEALLSDSEMENDKEKYFKLIVDAYTNFRDDSDVIIADINKILSSNKDLESIFNNLETYVKNLDILHTRKKKPL